MSQQAAGAATVAAPRTRTPEQVLLQVVALLNKTVANGATPAEAAAAASKAQALMFTYNLTTADVSKGKRGKVAITEGSFGMQTDTWRGFHYWQQQLLEGVCKFNFTMVLNWKHAYNPKVGQYLVSDVVVIGTPENIAATEYLYAYLYREIHRLAVTTRRQAWKDAKAKMEKHYGSAEGWSWGELGVPSTVVWERSFGDGATAEVVERLRLQRLASEHEVGPEAGAMVLTLDREVEEEWYRRKYGKTKQQYDAEQARKEEEWRAAAAARAAAQAELQAQYDAGTLPRPKAPKPRKERYHSPRTERWHYGAEQLGHEHGQAIQIREGVEGGTEAPVAPKELGN